MTQYQIPLSDSVYRLLMQQATRENLSLQQVAERLLVQQLNATVELDVQETPPTVDEALVAVQRLCCLFADVQVNWLEQALHDPMLEMANADLDLAW